MDLLFFFFVELLRDDVYFVTSLKFILNVVLMHVPAQDWCRLQWKILTCAITAGLCWVSLFDGANQDHDYYLARAAGLHCLETCFPKETTEGQLLSAELFSLLSMCVLAACLWPTDPEPAAWDGTSSIPHPPTPPHTPTTLPQYLLSLKHPQIGLGNCLNCPQKKMLTPLANRQCRKLYECKFWFLCVKQ